MIKNQKQKIRFEILFFYYMKFNIIIEEYIYQNHQQNFNEDLDGDIFISDFVNILEILSKMVFCRWKDCPN